jgi:hypothetical protein
MTIRNVLKKKVMSEERERCRRWMKQVDCAVSYRTETQSIMKFIAIMTMRMTIHVECTRMS